MRKIDDDKKKTGSLDAVMDVTEAQEDGDEITEVYWDTQRELLHDFLLRLYDEVISTWK